MKEVVAGFSEASATFCSNSFCIEGQRLACF